MYDDFLSLVNLLPDDIGDIYVRGPKKNGRNYGVCYFDSLGLTLYVWRGCIRFINVSNYDVFVNDWLKAFWIQGAIGKTNHINVWLVKL